ncbi:hypothetical protein ACQPZF_16990 [Actinosynnema sp. CS-041913]|uniref:hypothetical protein n=1 Tax=Actinosynnema sp. CS-041913 TaxID=3239917 RepID=UPI003D900321
MSGKSKCPEQFRRDAVEAPDEGQDPGEGRPDQGRHESEKVEILLRPFGWCVLTWTSEFAEAVVAGEHMHAAAYLD